MFALKRKIQVLRSASPAMFFHALKEKLNPSYGIVVIAIAIYTYFITVPAPISVTHILSSFHFGTTIILLLLLALTFEKQGLYWETVSLTLTLMLFGIALMYKWQTATYDGSLIGGLLPWSDASSYYENSQRLIFGLHLNTFGTRRPMFNGFLAQQLSNYLKRYSAPIYGTKA